MKLSSLFQQEDRQLIEKYCQERVHSSYVGNHTALCRVLGQLLMYVDTKDLSLTPHMLMNGFWEMWVTQAIANYVKPGMRCVDVGANCGYYTLLLSALVGQDGFVQAYEPRASLAEKLKSSILVNGFNQAQVSKDAIGERVEIAEFFIHPELMGSGSMRAFTFLDREVNVTYVNCITLDYDGLDVVPTDFVKIDVQGSEMSVLRGMQETIAGSPKIAIAMEFTPGDHEDPLGALQEIQAMGLTVRTIGTDGIVRPVQLGAAATPDTGDHRMLWLTRSSQ